MTARWMSVSPTSFGNQLMLQNTPSTLWNSFLNTCSEDWLLGRSFFAPAAAAFWVWNNKYNAPLGQRQPTAFRVSLGKAQPAGQGSDPSPLFATGETASEVSWPVLGSPVQEGGGHAEPSPKEGHSEGNSDGASVIWAEAETAGAVRLGEEKAPGDLINVHKHLIRKREWRWGRHNLLTKKMEWAQTKKKKKN